MRPMSLALLVLALFLVGAAAMITRVLPALIALPLMGIAIASGAVVLTGEIGWGEVLDGVVSDGAIMLHKAMIVTFFGGALSFVMQRSGVAESLVKQGAELVGADPLAVGIFSLLLVALLFSSLTGLGAVIMVSMIVLPMLATVGLSPAAGAGIVLFGMSLGGVLNPANWVLYVDTLGVPTEEVKRFALVLFVVVTLAGATMIMVELLVGRLVRLERRTVGTLVLFLSAVAGIGALLMGSGDASAGAEPGPLLVWTRRIVLAGFAALVLSQVIGVLRRASRWRHQEPVIRSGAYLIPLVPLVAILLFDAPILAAFVIGFAYAILATARPGSMALTVRGRSQRDARDRAHVRDRHPHRRGQGPRRLGGSPPRSHLAGPRSHRTRARPPRAGVALDLRPGLRNRSSARPLPRPAQCLGPGLWGRDDPDDQRQPPRRGGHGHAPLRGPGAGHL